MFNLHLARKQFTVMITKNVMFEPCNITRKIGKTLLDIYIYDHLYPHATVTYLIKAAMKT